jgi:hypothetical protein
MIVRSRRPKPADLGLAPDEGRTLRALTTPWRIQQFVSALPANFEEGGDTLHSVRNVLRHRRAHCLEAAFTAACALWLHGDPPLVMDLVSTRDDADHVVTLFRRNGCWGAISKSNHAWLRWRDPVYRNPRELAMSYFHEYFNKGRKTLRTFAGPIDLRAYDVGQWVTNADDCWDVGAALDDVPHQRLITAAQVRTLMPPDDVVERADDLVQYESADRSTARRY